MSGAREIRRWRTEEAVPWDLLLDADPSTEEIQRYWGRGPVWVVDTGQGVAGIVVVVETGPGTAEVMNLAVRETQRRRGYAVALLETVIAWGRERGLTHLEVGTGNSSFAALHLYQRMGFRIVGVDPDYFIRHYPGPIMENGLVCRDMVRLSLAL